MHGMAFFLGRQSQEKPSWLGFNGDDRLDNGLISNQVMTAILKHPARPFGVTAAFVVGAKEEAGDKMRHRCHKRENSED
jgi:hypothetical protein